MEAVAVNKTTDNTGRIVIPLLRPKRVDIDLDHSVLAHDFEGQATKGSARRRSSVPVRETTRQTKAESVRHSI